MVILTAKEYGYRLPEFMGLRLNEALATILTMQRMREAEEKAHKEAMKEMERHGNKQKR